METLKLVRTGYDDVIYYDEAEEKFYCSICYEEADGEATSAIRALDLSSELANEMEKRVLNTCYARRIKQFHLCPIDDVDPLGAIEILNLLDELHPTKNSPSQYRNAVREIKAQAIEAIKEGRL